MTNKGDDKKDKVTWKWWRGGATTEGDFGNPTGDTAYNLLIGSANGPLSAFFIPSGTLWKDLGSKPSQGFKYGDRRGANSGITKVALKPGLSEKAAVLVQGKGSSLGLSELAGLAAPVSIRLENAQSGACWEAIYDSAILVEGEGLTRCECVHAPYAADGADGQRFFGGRRCARVHQRWRWWTGAGFEALL